VDEFIPTKREEAATSESKIQALINTRKFTITLKKAPTTDHNENNLEKRDAPCLEEYSEMTTDGNTEKILNPKKILKVDINPFSGEDHEFMDVKNSIINHALCIQDLDAISVNTDPVTVKRERCHSMDNVYLLKK
jgi:hypothetical protein